MSPVSKLTMWKYSPENPQKEWIMLFLIFQGFSHLQWALSYPLELLPQTKYYYSIILVFKWQAGSIFFQLFNVKNKAPWKHGDSKPDTECIWDEPGPFCSAAKYRNTQHCHSHTQKELIKEIQKPIQRTPSSPSQNNLSSNIIKGLDYKSERNINIQKLILIWISEWKQK